MLGSRGNTVQVLCSKAIETRRPTYTKDRFITLPIYPLQITVKATKYSSQRIRYTHLVTHKVSRGVCSEQAVSQGPHRKIVISDDQMVH